MEIDDGLFHHRVRSNLLAAGAFHAKLHIGQVVEVLDEQKPPLLVAQFRLTDIFRDRFLPLGKALEREDLEYAGVRGLAVRPGADVEAAVIAGLEARIPAEGEEKGLLWELQAFYGSDIDKIVFSSPKEREGSVAV